MTDLDLLLTVFTEEDMAAGGNGADISFEDDMTLDMPMLRNEWEYDDDEKRDIFAELGVEGGFAR